MKKRRFIGVIIAIMLLLITLSGCAKDNVTVNLSYTESFVTIYTDEKCALDLTIEIKDGENKDTISKTFNFVGNRASNLSIKDFTAEYDNKDVIIIGASHGEPRYSYSELSDISSLCTFLIGCAIAIPITILILKSCKKSKSKTYKSN